jgi:hypothetical protein
MLYNEAILYNEPQVSYNGTLIINAPSLTEKLILNNIVIAISAITDYSNLTTIATIQYDITPSGVITITTEDEIAFAIAESNSITFYPYSENSTTLSAEVLGQSSVGQVYSTPSGEIVIEGLSA